MDLAVTRLHGELAGVQPDPRPMSIEDVIMHQIDRIGYLRSVGEEWSEPVFHLRDLVVGLEDAEFWNGVPRTVKVDALTQLDRDAYLQRGWNGIPVRVKQETMPDGSVVEQMDPSPAELSLMLRIVMGLFARRGMTWRRTSVDEVPMTFQDVEA